MSYCRFAWNGSDVYVILSAQGYTCYCRGDLPVTVTETPEEMIVHLAGHRRRGEFVPEYAITGLWADVDGPSEAVRPEPPELTRTRMFMGEPMLAPAAGGGTP